MHKLFKNTVLIGKKALFLPVCHSTNDVAASLFNDKEAEHGKVVYTDFQSGGRGQRGNMWESENGKNILLSVILDTSFLDPSAVYNLTMMTSLAIHDTLSEYISHSLRIKWPNDIYFETQKIAGILIENFIRQNVIQWCIAGMGININQVVFNEKKAVSLAMVCGQQFHRDELIEVVLQKLESRYATLKAGRTSELKRDYETRLYWKDEIHVFQAEGKYFNGRILLVEDSGKLCMETENGLRLFDLKEIVFVE